MPHKRVISFLLAAIIFSSSFLTQTATASGIAGEASQIHENPEILQLNLDNPTLTDSSGSVALPDPGDLLDLLLPEQLNGKAVKSITAGAFQGCPYLSSVTIPACITEIGENAFAEAPGLRYIVLEGRTSTNGMVLGDNWSGSAKVIFGNTETSLKTSYVINATAGAGGTISPSGSTSVMHGASHTYTIKPDAGYEIMDVKVDGKSVGRKGTYVFEDISENHTISASFKKKLSLQVGNSTITGLASDGTLKSGYGFGISIPCMVTNGTISATAQMSNGDTCVMQLVDGNLVFAKNVNSPTGARSYYVPVSTADGPFTCIVTIQAVSDDDPTNIITQTVTKTIFIKGSMYEDDFTGDRR